MSNLIVLNGLPGSGKTTVAKKLFSKLNIPLLSKDEIKELLFNQLGTKDREWSKKVGLTAYKILYSQLEAHLSAGNTVIFESNFKAESDQQKIDFLQKKYRCGLFQIYCTAEGSTLFKRFKKRAYLGTRHEGHADQENLEEFRVLLLNSKPEPLVLNGDLLIVDTNKPEKINYKNIFAKINSFLNS